ncbi:MAG: phage terminase large subunit, partial [Bdellovibrionales bacterium]
MHFRICEWLEDAFVHGDRRLLLMAFRACGKSTLVGLFVAWVLYQDPNKRILILSAEGALASKMVNNIRKIIEKHPLTRILKPRVPEQWSGDRFTVCRDRESRDPSVVARGITANITGARADMIVCDDVEVPNTCGNVERRANLRERLEETNFILVPDGTLLYVGTPHTYYSIYADCPRPEIGEERVFLDGYKRLKIPILDSHGRSAWAERFSEEDIEAQRVKSGPNKFQSQMMLDPVNILDGRLNPDLLNFYDDDIS